MVKVSRHSNRHPKTHSAYSACLALQIQALPSGFLMEMWRTESSISLHLAPWVPKYRTTLGQAGLGLCKYAESIMVPERTTVCLPEH